MSLPANLKPMPHQLEDAAWMFRQRRCINGSEMRCGKSLSAILASKYALKAEKGNRVLIVCPASLKRNWARELNLWFPTAPVKILEGDRVKRKKILGDYLETNGYLICNFEQLAARRDKDHSSKKLFTEDLLAISKMGFTVLIVDEAHILRSRQTLTFKGVSWVAQQTPYLFLLTGTPIVNRVTDLWTSLYMIDAKRFSSYWKFVDDPVWGCGKSKNDYGGYLVGAESKNPAAFKKMLEPYFTRRLLSDVIDDLPPLSTVKLWVNLGTKEKKVYDEMQKNWLAYLKGGQEVPAPVLISQITRLKQFCVSPDLAIMPEEYEKLGHGYDTIKYKTLLELIEGTDEKIVVFSQFEKAITLLMEMCIARKIGAVRFTGKETTRERDRAVELFKTEPGVQVFGMVKQERIAVGLDLSEAPIVVHMDEFWTNSVEDQATWRILGKNQKAKALVNYKILVKDSIEEWLVSEKLEGKRGMVSSIISMHDEFIVEKGK